jgi:hypothetical protein
MEAIPFAQKLLFLVCGRKRQSAVGEFASSRAPNRRADVGYIQFFSLPNSSHDLVTFLGRCAERYPQLSLALKLRCIVEKHGKERIKEM